MQRKKLYLQFAALSSAALISTNAALAQGNEDSRAERELNGIAQGVREQSARASLGELPQEAQEGKISVTMDVEANRKISNDDRASISLAAERLLRHVEKGRNSLAMKDSEQAKLEIDKALTLAKIIENNAPTYTIKTNIASEGIKYTDESEQITVPVPLYSSVGQASILGPVTKAKESSGSDQQASATVVKDAEFFVSRIDLDVAMARDHLKAADKALQNGNQSAAEDALTAVQRGVILMYGEVDVPLVEAGQNLSLARLQAKAGDTEEAERALKAAANSLQGLEGKASQSRSKEIQALRKEIQTAANNLEPDMDISDKVQNWQSTLSNM